jgi:Protein of unknown function (DUF1488)
MALSFERVAAFWDGNRDAVRFIGRDGDRAVQCFISMDSLQACFGIATESPVELLQVYRKHAERIHHAAERKYRTRGAGELTYVFLRSADL